MLEQQDLVVRFSALVCNQVILCSNMSWFLVNTFWKTHKMLSNHSPFSAIPAASGTRNLSFRAAVQDIQVARQHLNRAGSSSLAELTDEEKRAKVLGMFSSISNSSAWRTGTGTGLMKEQITDDHQGGPGASCCCVLFSLTGPLL